MADEERVLVQPITGEVVDTEDVDQLLGAYNEAANWVNDLQEYKRRLAFAIASKT